MLLISQKQGEGDSKENSIRVRQKGDIDVKRLIEIQIGREKERVYINGSVSNIKVGKMREDGEMKRQNDKDNEEIDRQIKEKWRKQNGYKEDKDKEMGKLEIGREK